MANFFEGFIFGSGIILFFILIFTGIWMADGKISIIKSYESEYNICQQKLINATTPQCAPVTCKSDRGNTFITIMWMLCGLSMLIIGLYEKNKASKILKEIEFKR